MSTSIQDLKSKKFYIALLSELLGTLFLVFVACGACSDTGEDNRVPSVVQISLAFGLSVATMVWCICNVSGGHINPAVTAGMLVTRKISVVRAVLYIVAQCVGAIIGAGLLRAVTPAGLNDKLGITNLGNYTVPKLGTVAVSAGQGFGIELLITFVLVFTVFASCDGNRKDLNGSAPLQIGLSVTMCHLFAVKFTGSSMNPARTFGPAIIAGQWENHWIYWVGPIAGGVLAGIIYDFILAVNATPAKVGGFFSRDYDDGKFNSRGRKNEDTSDAAELKPSA
eukprot:GHVU01153452.1.p1 GENE.GHVU01153452.1~~GHVU01153452.1.p1  ORF type:complete len:281 (+),score=24.85 GHVU01153452.1:141-983(+)